MSLTLGNNTSFINAENATFISVVDNRIYVHYGKDYSRWCETLSNQQAITEANRLRALIVERQHLELELLRLQVKELKHSLGETQYDGATVVMAEPVPQEQGSNKDK